MSIRPRLAVVLLLAALPLAAGAQPAVWSPWGGPDSPGGLFGGDPLDLRAGQPEAPLREDRIWVFLRGRFEAADRNRDGQVSPEELELHDAQSSRQAWFRVIDTDRNNLLSEQEVKALSGFILRYHDANRDNQLQPQEIRRGTPAPVPHRPAGPPPTR